MNLEVLHYVGYDDDRGGIVSVIRALAIASPFRSVLGVNPGFVQHHEPPLELLELPRIEGETINLRTLSRAWTVARRVQSWLREKEGRAFHGHSRAGLLVGLWLHWLGERRVVVSVHCYGRHRWFYRFAHDGLRHRLVWYSPAMKRHYGYNDPTWAGCMPNGVATQLPAVMHRGPAAGGVLRLGGAGALVRWKRWDLVLHALARLPDRTRIRFTHIGGALNTDASRACEKELHALTEKLGLTECVRWLGWQPGSGGLLKDVDAVVVPSDGEPFSMIAVEALFAGLPVIATTGGGPEDFIVEGTNGWLVPQDDPAALADRLARCLEPAEWQGLRVDPDHLLRFSMTETLAPRWAGIYSAL